VKNFLFVFLVVFCVQFTELKVDVIKISELILLIITPFLYFKKINKWILSLATIFIFWFLQTLLLNPFREFYLLENVSVLKMPYIISIGRFLELVSCINLAALVHLYLKNKDNNEKLILIKAIFNTSFAIMIINVLIYYLHIYGIIEKTELVYWTDRLRGWYGEGGPYGLMLSFTYILTFFYKSKYHHISRIIILFVIFFLAKSKAGIFLVLVWYFIIYSKRLYEKLKELNLIFIVAFSIFFTLIFIKLSEKYIDDIKNVKREMKERPTDVNLVMGRIAGVFIFPKMIVDYPILGIGLGNYPIMRNNPEYLEFIPKSPRGKTDAHGFGGLIQLLVNGGLIIFLSYIYIMYKFYLKIKINENRTENFLLIFLFFFIFGVQIYFLYPWVLFGILIAFNEKKISE
jgi:hypothetical protein